MYSLEFTSLKFLALLLGFAVLYRFCPVRFRAALLVAGSYAFYCTWRKKMALLLAGATLAAYVAGRAMDASKSEAAKRGIMAAFVSAVVAVLVTFKSTAFLPENVRAHLLMPLGLSYYTFKLIGYVVDIYWGKTNSEKGLLRFAAYVSFFPQIVAGPIQRSETFLPQLGNPPVRMDIALLGVQRIILGFFKKFVVADSLATVVGQVYGNLHAPGTPLLVGYYLFPLQLYADFSGLTDIAVGAALLLGIESPENFNAPFVAPNITEFWRRWHITLTTWLTDYVFTPLRMATRALGNAGLVLSLVINMVLIGVWHGIRPTFAEFGLVHAIFLSVEALTMRARKRYYKSHPAADRASNWIGAIVTFHLAAWAFVIFRAETLSDAAYLTGHLGSGLSAPSAEFLRFCGIHTTALSAALSGYVLIEIADYLRRHNPHNELVAKAPRWGRWSVYWCTAVTLLVMIILLLGGNAGHNPFLYEIF